MWHYKATVTKVIDGDTVRLKIDLGFYTTHEDTFRLARIDTPEMRGPEKAAGQKAKDRVIELCPVGSEVEARTAKTDKYGRWIAEVILGDGRVLNDILLKENLARPSPW